MLFRARRARQNAFLIYVGLSLGLVLIPAPLWAQTPQPQPGAPSPAPPASPGSAQTQPAPMTLSDAIRVLERERSAAEQYAVVLDAHGKKDMDRYVQGI